MIDIISSVEYLYFRNLLFKILNNFFKKNFKFNTIFL